MTSESDTKLRGEGAARARAGAALGHDASHLAIDARDLRKAFGDIVAVDGVSMAVETGAVFGLLGPDGAGKSTLITMLATVQHPDSGDALIFGDSVSRAGDRVKPRIGYMSQKFSMYPDLTVAENLEFFARLRGVPKADRRTRAPRLLEQMGMERFGDRLADKLSGGMKQKLMLASTLMTEPDLLLLDEPTTGVDPVSRREFWRIIATLHRQGKTVFVATPYMDEAERCTHIAFMDKGRLRETGTPHQIKDRVPGHLVEIVVDDQRLAARELVMIDGVRAANVLGETVRALVDDEGPKAGELERALRSAGLRAEDARRIPMDMEAAYSFLAERPGDEAAAQAFDERMAEELASGGDAR